MSLAKSYEVYQEPEAILHISNALFLLQSAILRCQFKIILIARYTSTMCILPTVLTKNDYLLIYSKHCDLFTPLLTCILQILNQCLFYMSEK